MIRYVYLDFEFNGVKDETMNVICVSYYSIIDGVERIETIWLLDPEGKKRFIGLLETWCADDIPLVAFYAIAEARAILSLGFDPRRFRGVDLWIEYRMLLNHNHRYECGKQLIDGKVKFIKPPKPKWDREDGYSTGGKAEISLAACTYKMLGISRDTEHKKAMRDLIIHNVGNDFTEIEAMDIMEYCEEDILHLPKIHAEIFKAIYKTYEPVDRKNLKEEMCNRGEYAVATAIMEKKGYPIDYVASKSFSDSVPEIVFQMQKEVNDEFPEVGAFLISVKQDKYTQKKKRIQKWVEARNIKNWMLTDKGALSLKLDAFEEHFSHKNDQTIFGNRFVKYLRDKQSLNGFSVNSSKTTLWDYIGKDKRIRPHFGIFVAQSSRSQPSATGYIMLKSRWMRVLVQPPKGKCIAAIDYGQQEFLIAALLSEMSVPEKNRRMIEAYHSGDPYLHTAKIAKAVPQDATKKSHGAMRDKFKSTVLAIQYSMTEYGLQKKLTNDTKVHHTVDEALELIQLFEAAYPSYVEWKSEIFEEYVSKGYIRLRDGWTMFGDNHNKRSVTNMPVQGLGAAIMRKAVILAQDKGLDVIMTLHDAIYIECHTSLAKANLEILATCMREAFKFYFLGTPVEKDAVCRLDPTLWGPGLSGEKFETSMGRVTATSKYIDRSRFEDNKNVNM
jgi:DNA polymerase-1